MPQPFHHTFPRLGYALNAFPYHTLAELQPVLETDLLAIKQRMYPATAFPIELRVSDPIVAELRQQPETVARLKSFFAEHDLALVTLNAFVMPRFHGQPVKETVYLPAWHETSARLEFTRASLDLLANLAAEPSPSPGAPLSVSVPFEIGRAHV